MIQLPAGQESNVCRNTGFVARPPVKILVILTFGEGDRLGTCGTSRRRPVAGAVLPVTLKVKAPSFTYQQFVKDGT